MTIGILSYGAHETLKRTLDSYEKFDLPRYDSERVIFFNGMTEKDVQIADYFGYKHIGSEINLGIAQGYKRLVEYTTGEFFLFLENDWELVDSPLYPILDAKFLLNYTVDIVKLRHRWEHGAPLWSYAYKDRELELPTHLLDSVHWISDPDQRFPDYITKLADLPRDWYTASSRNANWSNNPHMARTQWLKDNILPHLVGNTGDIEKELQGWWEQQYFRVAQGDGLFKHYRID